MSKDIYKNVICPNCDNIGVVRRIEWLAWQCPSCEVAIDDIYILERYSPVDTCNDECDCCITKEDLEMVDECNHECPECSGCNNTIPYRLKEWLCFSDDVENHITDYTIPQYGDYPNDQLTTTTNECIVHDMKRYLNRFGKGQRGYKEAMRDMLKVAQYAGVLYNRLQQESKNVYSDVPFKDCDGNLYFPVGD